MPNPFSIQIIDDGMDLCREVYAWLEQAGYAVACSQPVRTLVSALMNQPPDLLIIGMRNNHGAGYETYERICSHRQLRHLPLIVLSENADLEYEILDAYDFQAWPGERSRLLKTIAQLATAGSAKVVGHFSVEQLEPFKELLHQRSGLHFSVSNWRLLERGLQRRMQALQIGTPQKYLAYLEREADNRDEFNKLVGLLTVGETCFFRYRSHHDALVHQVFPSLIARNAASQRLRIWSAGCSTGEEPYSLAIKLLDNFPQLSGWDVQILATDINKRSLRQAREGVYAERALRQAEPRYRERYFRVVEGHFQVESQVRRKVRFAHLNLQADRFPDAGNGTAELDLILCRNVLIYFHLETIRQIVARFADSLNPQGYLFLGHAETLQYVSDRFVRHHQHNAFYYQLKEPQAVKMAPVSRPPQKVSAPAPPSARILPPPQLSSPPPARTPSPGLPPLLAPTTTMTSPEPPAKPDVEQLYRQAMMAFDREEFAAADQLFDQILTLRAEHPLALVGKGLISANQGHYDESRKWCARAIQYDDLCPAAYLLRGLILDMEEQLERALVEYQKVLWLDRDFVMAHYLLAKVHGRLAQTDQQGRALRNAIRILEKQSDQGVLPFSGGLSRPVFLDICRRELGTLPVV
jgi:chemotaxis protein methyltransferase CheR